MKAGLQQPIRSRRPVRPRTHDPQDHDAHHHDPRPLPPSRRPAAPGRCRNLLGRRFCRPRRHRQAAAHRRRQHHRRRGGGRPVALGGDRHPGHRGRERRVGLCQPCQDPGLRLERGGCGGGLQQPAGALRGTPGLQHRRHRSPAGPARPAPAPEHRRRQAACGRRRGARQRHPDAADRRGCTGQTAGVQRPGRDTRRPGRQTHRHRRVRQRNQALPRAGHRGQRHAARHPGQPERAAGLWRHPGRRRQRLRDPARNLGGLPDPQQPGRGL